MQIKCVNCGSMDEGEEGHFCHNCGTILPSPADEDLFAHLGLPRAVKINEEELTNRFHALSKQFHPDLYHQAPPAIREIAFQRSMLVNRAYTTLKNESSRINYLIALETGQTGEQTSQISAKFFDTVERLHELQERLTETEDETEISRAEAGLTEIRDEMVQTNLQLRKDLLSLGDRWDENERCLRQEQIDRMTYEANKGSLIMTMKEKKDELAYVETLLATLNHSTLRH